MKKYLLLVAVFCLSLSTFSQGISVQGIARDAAGSAMTNKSLTFTFIIADGNAAPIFTETQAITTDLFGVFSHIVGTGNATGAAFSAIDFSLNDLRLKISVKPAGEDIEIYNQPFQYTPYAHYAKRAASADNAINAANAVNADNGVPTGAIMPFLGENAPAGWVLCDGLNISSVPGSQALRTLLDSEHSPNLKGRFLKGVGTPVESNVDEITLNDSQSQQTRTNQHIHTVGNLETTSEGKHRHTTNLQKDKATTSTFPLDTDGGTTYYTPSANNDGSDNLASGYTDAHKHTITGATGNTTATTLEVRPSSYGVNYIIKL